MGVTLVHVLGTENQNLLSAITRSFIIYHELEHFKMFLDIVTGMNETHTLPGDNSDTDIDLGYEKNFHNGLSDYDNKSMYITILSTSSEESAISMLLIIFLKISHHLVEVMFVLKVLLLILKVTQSGIHHICVGGHA